MEIEEFKKITWRGIRKDGINNFLPTLCIPNKRVLRVLTGIPLEVDPLTAAESWAKEKAGEGIYL